jgi:hypothetical protein
MYPWDSRADGPRTKKPAARHQDAAVSAASAAAAAADPDPATAAVQVALDRRDNGGEGTRQLSAVAATASQVRK